MLHLLCQSRNVNCTSGLNILIFAASNFCGSVLLMVQVSVQYNKTAVRVVGYILDLLSVVIHKYIVLYSHSVCYEKNLYSFIQMPFSSSDVKLPKQLNFMNFSTDCSFSLYQDNFLCFYHKISCSNFESQYFSGPIFCYFL